MKCVIPGLNIKIFARAIHTLSRIGDELYVEPSDDGLSFRTVDSSRSAFGSFYFKSGFFSLFDFKSPECNGEEERLKCKVAMKACLNAFRSVNSIDKTVEKCKLIIDPEGDRLIINMTCRHGINKTYNLSFIECETLQAVFDRNNCPFSITSQSRFLCDAFVNFHSNQEEVTLSVSSDKATIRSYVDDEPDPTKAIHTELTLEADEFEQYQVGGTCEITFSLKELRAFLSFSEPVNLPVSFVFTKPGNPVIFFAENPPMFEANFVLATLSSTQPPSSQQSNLGSVQQNLSNNIAQEKAESSKKRSSEVDVDLDNKVARTTDYIGEVSSRLATNRLSGQHSTPKNETCRNNGSTGEKLLTRKSFSFHSGTPILQPDTNLPSPGLSRSRQPFVRSKSSNLESESQNEMNEKTENCVEEKRNQTVIEESDEESNEIPRTPPAKRRRYFFKRCFESTFNAENISQFNRILAEDSDGDT